MALFDFLFGSKDKLKKVPTGSPQQQALHNQMLAQAMGMGAPGGGFTQSQDYFQNLLGGGGYEQFAEPYMQQFQEQILPMLAERFAGVGGLSSSGFGQALGGAGAGLQSQLAQMFSGLQQQAAGSLANQYGGLASQGLGYQPFAYKNRPGSAGLLGSLGVGLGGSMGQPMGFSLGNRLFGANPYSNMYGG